MSESHTHKIAGCMCIHVAQGTSPIRQVVRHHDGFWEFSCAIGEHPNADDFKGLCRECNLQKLNEYQLLKELQPGQWASKSDQNGRKWQIFLLPPMEEPK